MSHNLPEQTRSNDQPNYELLLQSGWAVTSAHGDYCVVFRGSDEVILAWRDGRWQPVGNRHGAFRAA